MGELEPWMDERFGNTSGPSVASDPAYFKVIRDRNSVDDGRQSKRGDPSKLESF